MTTELHTRFGPNANRLGPLVVWVVVREGPERSLFQVLLVRPGSTEPVLARTVQLEVRADDVPVPLQPLDAARALLPQAGEARQPTSVATFIGPNRGEALHPRATVRVGRDAAVVPLVRGRPLPGGRAHAP